MQRLNGRCSRWVQALIDCVALPQKNRGQESPHAFAEGANGCGGRRWLRRIVKLLDPGLTAWANVGRTYGAKEASGDCRLSFLIQGLQVQTLKPGGRAGK